MRSLPSGRSHLLKLSAKSKPRLRQQAEQLARIHRANSGGDRGRRLLVCKHRLGRFQPPRRRSRATRLRSACESGSGKLRRGDARTAAGVKQARSARSAARTSRFCSRARDRSTSAWAADCMNRSPCFVDVWKSAMPFCGLLGRQSLLESCHLSRLRTGRLRANCGPLPDGEGAAIPPNAIHAAGAVRAGVRAGRAVGFVGREAGYRARAQRRRIRGRLRGRRDELEDGLRLIAERARLMQSVKRHGKMAVVFAARERVAREIASAGGEVVIAVLNGPENTVISGEAAAVDDAVGEIRGRRHSGEAAQCVARVPLAADGRNARRIRAVCRRHRVSPPQVPLAANLTGQLMTEAPTARYWRDHLRNAVQFAAGMARVAEAAPAIVIEIGPTASLLGHGAPLRAEAGSRLAAVAARRTGRLAGHRRQRRRVLRARRAHRLARLGSALAAATVAVAELSVPAVAALDSTSIRRCGGRSRATHRSAVAATSASGRVHPLLGPAIVDGLGEPLVRVAVEHAFAGVFGRSPGARLGGHAGGGVHRARAGRGGGSLWTGQHGLANLVIQQAMFLPERASGGPVRRRVQLAVAPESGGEATFETYSRSDDEDAARRRWNMHAAGTLVHESKSESSERCRTDRFGGRARPRASITLVTRRVLRFDGRSAAWRTAPRFKCWTICTAARTMPSPACELPESVVREAPDVSSASRAGRRVAAVDGRRGAARRGRLVQPLSPTCRSAFAAFAIAQTIDDFSQPLFVYARRTSSDSRPSPERVEADVYLVAADGEVLVAFEGAQVQRLGRSGAADSGTDTSRWLYEIAWREEPLAADESATAGQSAARLRQPSVGWCSRIRAGVANKLAEQLAARGQRHACWSNRRRNIVRGRNRVANGHPNRLRSGQRSIRSMRVTIAD